MFQSSLSDLDMIKTKIIFQDIHLLIDVTWLQSLTEVIC